MTFWLQMQSFQQIIHWTHFSFNMSYINEIIQVGNMKCNIINNNKLIDKVKLDSQIVKCDSLIQQRSLNIPP